MKEAVHSFFMTPGYGGLLVCVVVVVLLATYFRLALWISQGAEVNGTTETDSGGSD